MTYAPYEPVRLVARVLKPDFSPVEDATLRAAVRIAGNSSGDGRTAFDQSPSSLVDFAYVSDSQGLYEAVLPPLGETGAYAVSLLDPERYSGEDAAHEVSTVFFVASARRPIEMSTVSASRGTVDALARWTGGRVVQPHEAAGLANAFGEGSRTVKEPLEIALWCRPWLFLLIVGLVLAEWILRKLRGLV
jgi:hypothetical protein